jgi:hypothetical protein
MQRKLQGIQTYLVISRVEQVLVVSHVNGVFGSAENYVGDTQALGQDPVMIADIVDDEDTLAIFVVGGDNEATRSAEALC